MFCGSSTEAGRLIVLFNQLLREGLVAQLFDGQQYAGVSLTEAQFRMLQCVYQHEQATVSQVAEALRISRAAATKGLQRLEEKGLVRRGECAQDRRLLELRLTPRGQEVIRAVRAGFQERLEAILKGLNPEKREALVQALSAFLRAALSHQEFIHLACLRCGFEHDPACLVNQAQRNLTGTDIAPV